MAFETHKNRYAFVLMLVSITLPGILIYANVMHSPFVFDDISNILRNPHIRMTGFTLSEILDAINSRSSYRPLPNISFALNYYVNQYHTFGYHAVNLLIHLITAVLIFLVTQETMRRLDQDNICIPFFAATLWLVNPVHTQSVSYIVQRMNSMAVMFYMTALFLYIRARQIQVARAASWRKPVFLFSSSVMAGMGALASKQIAATLPFFILLYEWYFFRDLDMRWLKRQLKWIVALSALFVLIVLFYLGVNPMERIMALYSEKDFSMVQRLMTEPRVILFYLALLTYPHPGHLNLDYDYPLSTSLFDPITTVFSILTLTMLLIAAVVLARRHRLLSFSIIWFLGNLAIESSIIGLALIFEHRTYLPSIFLIIAISWVWMDHIPHRRFAMAGLGLIICIFGFWTYQRNITWQDKISLWQDSVLKSPNKARPHNCLGRAYSQANMNDAAIRHFKKVIELDPTYSNPFNNLGELYSRQGEYDTALQYLAEALRLGPGFAPVHNNIGNVLLKQDRLVEAKTYFEKAIHLDPLLEEAHNNLGVVHARRNNIKQAIVHFERALEIHPTYQQPRENLSQIISYKESLLEKITRLKKQLQQKPDDPGLLFELGDSYKAIGEQQLAIDAMQDALARQPDFPACLETLAVLYASAGQQSKAVKYYQRLAHLMPDNPYIHYNLAALHARLNATAPAIESLKEAVARGYHDQQQILMDPDFASIRGLPAFEKLMKDLK